MGPWPCRPTRSGLLRRFALCGMLAREELVGDGSGVSLPVVEEGMRIRETGLLVLVPVVLGLLLAGAVRAQGIGAQASAWPSGYDAYTNRAGYDSFLPDAAQATQPSGITFTPAFTTYIPFAVLTRLTPDAEIAFVSQRDGNPEIYVTNPQGGWPSRLTNDSAGDYAPAWSPDNSKIAFFSDRDGFYGIYVMDADGSGQIELSGGTAHDAIPHWSPDGTQIAFCSDRDGGVEIYVMNSDGTGQTRLTNNSVSDWGPVWSPDGTKIAYWSGDGFAEGSIFVMNADGTGSTLLSDSIDSSPDWSPDGSKIAFVSKRDGNPEIYVMNAAGTEQTRLTNNWAIVDASPNWSPDGTQIAFDSDRDGNREIYVMHADGTFQTRMTFNPKDDWSPDW
jgi:Tol biopolymer transport system component